MYFSAYGAVSATILQPNQLREAKHLLTALTIVHVANNSPFIRESKGLIIVYTQQLPPELTSVLNTWNPFHVSYVSEL